MLATSPAAAVMARPARLAASSLPLAARSSLASTSTLARARAFSSSAPSSAITPFAMPAMSPTMTEGGLATWKVKEGGTFAAGDVLLEIETDKATMDVEAQDDGIMAKILVQEGAKAVPVGKVIAMLAEEGDDISNVEAPKEDKAPAKAEAAKKEEKEPKKSAEPPTKASSAPTASPPKAEGGSTADQAHVSSSSSSGEPPVFPSVARLLHENHISPSDARSIKPTGVRGMLTKGDVLAHLGKAKSPTGSLKEETAGIARYVAEAIRNWSKEGGAPGGGGAKPQEAAKPKSKEATEPITADSLRSLILSGLASSSPTARLANVASTTYNPHPRSPSSGDKAQRGAPTTTTTNDVLSELVGEYNFGKRGGGGGRKGVAVAPKGGKGKAKGAFAGLL